MAAAPETLLDQWKREEVEPFAGWDFSHLTGRWLAEKPPWSYESMARALLPGCQALLDLGTGGGERLMRCREVFPARVVATEGYPPNLALARQRLGPLSVEVIECQDSLDQKLPFADGEFDLVICRHSAFNPAEVHRILRPSGTFLTQQVDGRNLADLSAAFEARQPWPFWTLDFLRERAKSDGLVVQAAQEWSGKTVVKDVGAIVYYLRAVPWTVPGFSVEKHQACLQDLQKRLEASGELVFQQRMFVVRASRRR